MPAGREETIGGAMKATRTFRRLSLEAGEAIFAEGDHAVSLFQVEKGAVEVWRDAPEGRRPIGRIGAGELVGEMALFDNRPRMATATALEPTVVLEIPASVLREAINRADPMIVTLVRTLAARLRAMAEAPASSTGDRTPERPRS